MSGQHNQLVSNNIVFVKDDAKIIFMILARME